MHLNEALLIAEAAEHPGTVALLEATKFHEAQFAIEDKRELPESERGELICGCDDPALCTDRDATCYIPTP